MSYQLSGANPLAYRGVEPASPPNLVIFIRSPNSTDLNFALGTIWLRYYAPPPPTSPIYEVWMLAATVPVAANFQEATWIQLYPSGGTGAAQFPTDNGTANQVAGILNLLAETTTGGILTTMGSGNTVTYNGASTIANNYTGNAGPGATPSANILQIVGTGNVSTNATGNTVTISLAGAVATQYTTQDGVAIPATNNINIYGEPLLLNTTASGSTVTVNLTDSSSNGEVIIGGGGSGAVWNKITSNGGTITITYPMANTINLENAGVIAPGGPGGYAVIALSSAIVTQFTPTINQEIFYGAMTAMPAFKDNSGGNYTPGNGAGTPATYTAPATGIYQFNAWANWTLYNTTTPFTAIPVQINIIVNGSTYYTTNNVGYIQSVMTGTLNNPFSSSPSNNTQVALTVGDVVTFSTVFNVGQLTSINNYLGVFMVNVTS